MNIRGRFISAVVGLFGASDKPTMTFQSMNTNINECDIPNYSLLNCEFGKLDILSEMVQIEMFSIISVSTPPEHSAVTFSNTQARFRSKTPCGRL